MFLKEEKEIYNADEKEIFNEKNRQGIFLGTCLGKKFISFESLVKGVRQAETALDRIYKDQLSDGATIN